MTSQCLILRKEEILIGSDFAVTTPDGKSYNDGKKIFELEENYPYGIMVNGYVDFEGISIDTWIDEFKNESDFERISRVEEMKEKFISFLEKKTPPNSCEKYFSPLIDDFKDKFREELNYHGL